MTREEEVATMISEALGDLIVEVGTKFQEHHASNVPAGMTGLESVARQAAAAAVATWLAVRSAKGREN
jgi:hypothetical protein